MKIVDYFSMNCFMKYKIFQNIFYFIACAQ